MRSLPQALDPVERLGQAAAPRRKTGTAGRSAGGCYRRALSGNRQREAVRLRPGGRLQKGEHRGRRKAAVPAAGHCR